MNSETTLAIILHDAAFEKRNIISRTCKNWNQIIHHDSSLFKKLYFQSNHARVEVINQLDYDIFRCSYKFHEYEEDYHFYWREDHPDWEYEWMENRDYAYFYDYLYGELERRLFPYGR